MGLCVQTSANVKTSHVTHSLGTDGWRRGKEEGRCRTDRRKNGRDSSCTAACFRLRHRLTLLHTYTCLLLYIRAEGKSVGVSELRCAGKNRKPSINTVSSRWSHPKALLKCHQAPFQFILVNMDEIDHLNWNILPLMYCMHRSSRFNLLKYSLLKRLLANE